jgi:hypothetical protein
MFFPISAGASWSFGNLAWHPTPALSLYASPDLCWVLAAPLGGWLVDLFLLSAFAALPMLDNWQFHHPCSPGQIQYSTSTSTVGVRLQFTVYVFQFFWVWGGIQSAQGLHWIIFLGSGWVTCSAWCLFVHFLVSRKQLWSRLLGRKSPFFSEWCGIGRLSMG